SAVPMPRIETNARPTLSELMFKPGTVAATSATERRPLRSMSSALTAVIEIGTSSSDSSRLRAVTVTCSIVPVSTDWAPTVAANIRAKKAPPGRTRLLNSRMDPPKKMSGRVENFPRIQNAVRVPRLLEPSHQRDDRGPELRDQLVALTQADAVLARAGAIETVRMI